MDLDPATIQQITDYLNIRAPAEQASFAFVFGTRLPDPAHIAARLYHLDVIPAVVVTGGPNRLTGEPEALLHREILLAAGVPPERVIVEDRSTNTLENVTLALPLIAAQFALESVESVLAICKWMHARRALMTLKRHLPPGIRYYVHTYYPDGITPENWPTSDEGRARVLKNWEGIPHYLAADHIADITFEHGAYV